MAGTSRNDPTESQPLDRLQPRPGLREHQHRDDRGVPTGRVRHADSGSGLRAAGGGRLLVRQARAI